MKSIFEAVKANVSVPDAAIFYGLHVSRSRMTCCIFHPDRNPSMKLYDDHFHCFGCHKHGDVIALTAQLFDLSPFKAAEKLAADFNILPPPEGYTALETTKRPIDEKEEKLLKHIRLLSDYDRMLLDWKENYAPVSPQDEKTDWRFVHACHELPWIEEMCDCLNSIDEDLQSWADQELESECYYEKMKLLLSIDRKETDGNGTDEICAA